MKNTALFMVIIFLAGCQTFVPAFTRMKPAYEELPVETLKATVLQIEQAVQEGRVPELTDKPDLKVDTPAIRQSITARVSRSELVNQLLDRGFAWERRNGHLYILRSREYKQATTRRERDRNALIVTGEWDDRWMMYENLRKVNGFSPRTLTAIQRIFHEARTEVMRPGQLYENAEGDPVPIQ